LRPIRHAGLVPRSPTIVTVWFGVSAGLLLAFGRDLATLLRPAT